MAAREDFKLKIDNLIVGVHRDGDYIVGTVYDYFLGWCWRTRIKTDRQPDKVMAEEIYRMFREFNS